MRFYVAAVVFFVLGCLSIGGSIWARLQIGREIFYRTTELGMMEFKSYRYAVIFQAKQIFIGIISKIGIWVGVFFLLGALNYGFVMGGR